MTTPHEAPKSALLKRPGVALGHLAHVWGRRPSKYKGISVCGVAYRETGNLEGKLGFYPMLPEQPTG